MNSMRIFRACKVFAAVWVVGQVHAASASTAPPTALPSPALKPVAQQADQAEERRYFLPLIQGWSLDVLSPPAKAMLDADMSARLKALDVEWRPQLEAAGLRWLAEARAAEPSATQLEIGMRLLARLNDELVGWLVSSPGTSREATEWALAQKPAYCRDRASLHTGQWALLADRLLFLQPLTGAERDAALAAEHQRLQAWLSGALPQTATPTPPPHLQAFQAAERQRAGDPVGSRGMLPWLSRQMLGERPPELHGGLSETCALVQWWLVGEVEKGALTPDEAMRQFRYGLLPDSRYLLFIPHSVRKLAHEALAGDYPPPAALFGVTGRTRATVLLDATGRVLEVLIMERHLSRPGLEPGRPALALEQMLDHAAYARLRATRFARPDASQLVKGVAREIKEVVWGFK